MRRVFRWVGVAVTAVAIAVGSAEILLQVRSAALQRAQRDETPLKKLQRAYSPFTQQHPHPHYMFFFPLEARDRLALGNAVCSIDADGFREPGPSHAGARKLAVVLGGSAAFGDYASANDQTITSHLNRLQDEYFFVNAGVPSWNSTQQLIRLALDIVERRPALIVAYDGANDAVLAGQIRSRTGAAYPPGTPEFFDTLERLIEEDDDPLAGLHPRALLPELTLRFDKWFSSSSSPADDDDTISDADITAAARRYRANHSRMAELSNAAGAKFISVFQPIANLHEHIDSTALGRRPLVEKFHREATGGLPPPYDLVDLSSVFNGAVPQITLAGPELADDAMFVDLVHLTDRGNAFVAERLWKLIAMRGASVTTP